MFRKFGVCINSWDITPLGHTCQNSDIVHNHKRTAMATKMYGQSDKCYLNWMSLLHYWCEFWINNFVSGLTKWYLLQNIYDKCMRQPPYILGALIPGPQLLAIWKRLGSMFSVEEVSSSNFHSPHTSRLSLDWQRRESLYFEVPTHDKSYLIFTELCVWTAGSHN